MSNTNSILSGGEKKKKKFVKAEKTNESLAMKSSFETQSIKFEEEISEINSISKVNTLNQSALSLLEDQKSQPRVQKTFIITNLHHDDNYGFCQPEFEQKQMLKSIKKYIKKAFKGAKDIEVFYGKKTPTLKFQYQDIKKNQRKIRDLGDLLKANKELGEREYEVIIKIFDQLYHRINSSELGIEQFLKVLTQKKKIDLDFSSFKKTPLLYYQFQEKKINFTFFDKNMRMFEFSSEATNDLRFQTQDLKHWTTFLANLNHKKAKNQKHFDQFGQHQVSSDDEGVRYEDTVSMQEVQGKITGFLDADLASYEQELQQMECKCNQMLAKNDQSQKPMLEKFSEQLSELHTNLSNFKEAMSYVRGQLGRAKKDLYRLKNLLKILIIAQKQLKSRLPIVARKQEIFRKLDKSDLVILEGETGSGKSTQLPQMLCEYLRVFQADSKDSLPILITQPRRLATRTVAERVAYEMQEKIGGFVDYATSSYKPVSRSAKILFKLDSVVLDELTADRSLSKYSCLIIDEAHERTISIDVILGLVKDLQEIRKGFKVIVTSASLDAKLFQDYFKSKVMKVSGRLYPVQVLYHPIVHQPDMIKKIESVIKKNILQNNSQMKPEYRGDILVFCSGVDDINILCSIFERYLNPKIFRVLALHGKIAVGQQKEVFLETKELKVIFASRIAQTSITINGVKVVVDPGVDRQLVYDQKFRVSSRKLVNISQSSAKQRAGRAGRTSNGFCFRLYSQAELFKFRVNKTPQIDNIALDTVVLRLKSLNVDNIYTFKYIKVPDKQALKMSVQTLQMIGGLDENQHITTIGKLLLQLHIQPFLGRSIVQAIVLDHIVRNTKYIQSQAQTFSKWKFQDVRNLKSLKQLVIEILCMVINSSNLFYSNISMRQRVQEIKYVSFASERGDFNYLSNIYSEFYHMQKEDKSKLDAWINRSYLNKKTLFQTKELTEQIFQIIKNFKFDPKDPAIVYLIDTIKLKLMYCKNLDDAILSCMITSFCVNLCLYSQNPRVGYTHVLQKKPLTIYGTSTLALQGLYPKWIVCYDLKDSKDQTNTKDKKAGSGRMNVQNKGVTYCQIAHEVSFEFLKRTVEDYVFKKLNLKEAQKMNPFYDKIDKVLPTCILREIQIQYMNSENNNHPILKYITYDVTQQANKISIFYSKNLNAGHIYAEKTLVQSNVSMHDLINDYIQTKRIKKRQEKLIYNIISNIFVQFDDGFLVKSLKISDVQIQFLAKGERVILNQIRQILEGTNAYVFGSMLKIITFGKGEETRVRNLLTEYMLQFDEQKRQKKQDSMSAKIYMTFYTGKLKKDPLFMYYGPKYQYPAIMIQKLEEFQAEFKKNINKSKFAKIICESKFSINFKKTGIKCFNSNIDAFQLKEALQNLCINGMLPFDFILPRGIQQFRDIQSSTIASRSQKEWQDEISKVLAKYKLTGLIIAVKNQKSEEEESRAQNIQKFIKHEIIATITSNSLQTIDEMVRLFDGKQGIIGCGKIHFRYNFKQLIAKVNKRAFDALYDQFTYQKNMFQTTSNVKIETYYKQFGKVGHIFITCRSPVRQNLLKPTEVLGDLFTPFIKRLEISHFKFLNDTDQGEAELERIEQNLQYRILFGFTKKNHSLRIYCLDYQYQVIDKRIDSIFHDHHLFVQSVSYKTKGLNRVEEALEIIIKQNAVALKKDKNSKLNLNYTIVYKRREVQISGDLISINRARKDLQKLANSEPGSCNLCNKDVENPFKLINCMHEFCWKCLGDYIDESKKDEDQQSNVSGIFKVLPLSCPHEGCGVYINPSDLQVLLSSQQFQAFSYRRVKQFVKNHHEYFFCPTARCQQIFQTKVTKEKSSFECVICGHWFCSVCKQPHQHFTCDEWSRKLSKGELLSFGFKKCSCGYIIQKEQKGKMIRCKQCNEYLCWRCNKSWKNEKPCADHVRVCKI